MSEKICLRGKCSPLTYRAIRKLKLALCRSRKQYEINSKARPKPTDIIGG